MSIDENLPFELLARIDRLCEEFECDWSSGTPQLDDYLKGLVPGDVRHFIGALLEIEISERESRGESVDFQQYAARYPQYIENIRCVFERHALKSKTVPVCVADDVKPDSIELRTKLHDFALHASGGMGDVWLAADRQNHRKIAVKVVQHRFHGNLEAEKRFLREAEITSLLDHPGIAPMFGIGRLNDGRPYYAMRYIEGESLHEWLRRFHAEKQSMSPQQRRLSLRQLMSRFMSVCQSIDYAHSKRILHRDLKPQNVMIGKYGETLVVDWGLAKVLDDGSELAINADPANDGDTPSTSKAMTLSGQAIGTPSYMSPEQAQGNSSDLGPATDVYSLGATLYELLTGQPPVRGDSAVAILEKARRHEIVAPRSVWPDIPRALEEVCLKAMALEPIDRYSSAKALSGDIEQWLADEPVSAYAEPWSLQVKRWISRHPSVVSSMAVTLILGIFGATLVAYREGAYNSQLTAKNATIEQQKRDVENTLSVVSQRTAFALEAYEQMVFDIQEKLERRSNTEEIRRQLLEKARAGLIRILSDARKQGAPDRALWAGHFRIADIELALGNRSEAHKEYLLALKAAEELTNADPTAVEAQRDLCASLVMLGNYELQGGQIKEASEYYQKALGLSESLIKTNSHDMQVQRGLASCLGSLGSIALATGQTEKAKAYYERSLAIYEELTRGEPQSLSAQSDLGLAYQLLGDTAVRQGQAIKAMELLEKSRQIRQSIVDADPHDVKANRMLSISLERLGNLTFQQKDFETSLKHRLRTVEIRKLAAETDLQNVDAQRDYSLSIEKVGNVFLTLGKLKDAEDCYQKSLAIRLRITDAHPDDFRAQGDLAFSYEKLGNVRRDLGMPREAMDFYEKSLATRLKIMERHADHPGLLREIGWTYERLGKMAFAQGQIQESASYHQKSLETRRPLADAAPNDIIAIMDLQNCYVNLGEVEKSNNNYEAALRWFEDGRKLLLPWHEKQLLTGERETAFAFFENEIASCKSARAAIDDIEFVFAQMADRIPALVVIRVRSLLRDGKLDEAIKSADRFEAWAMEQKQDLDQQYNTACLYALCAASSSGEEHRVRLIETCTAILNRCKSLNYFSSDKIAHFSRDPDFSAIRTHPSFEIFANSLNSTAPE
jgi:serine/threonine protein kinase